MPTPQEICETKWAVVKRYRPTAETCQFGRPNRYNPEVLFTGCPACKLTSEANTPLTEVEADMVRYMDKATRFDKEAVASVERFLASREKAGGTA